MPPECSQLKTELQAIRSLTSQYRELLNIASKKAKIPEESRQALDKLEDLLTLINPPYYKTALIYGELPE